MAALSQCKRYGQIMIVGVQSAYVCAAVHTCHHMCTCAHTRTRTHTNTHMHTHLPIRRRGTQLRSNTQHVCTHTSMTSHCCHSTAGSGSAALPYSDAKSQQQLVAVPGAIAGRAAAAKASHACSHACMNGVQQCSSSTAVLYQSSAASALLAPPSSCIPLSLCSRHHHHLQGALLWRTPRPPCALPGAGCPRAEAVSHEPQAQQLPQVCRPSASDAAGAAQHQAGSPAGTRMRPLALQCPGSRRVLWIVTLVMT